MKVDNSNRPSMPEISYNEALDIAIKEYREAYNKASGLSAPKWLSDEYNKPLNFL